MSDTKRSHYIPQCYSQNFCIEGKAPSLGFLYSKRSPNNVNKVPPKNFGIINNDLSFRKNDGTLDRNTFEIAYGTIESQWPGLVEKFENQTLLDDDSLTYFYLFLSMMAFRVPNFRRRLESNIANEAKTMIKVSASDASTFPKDMDSNLKEKAILSAKEGLFDVVVHPQESLKNLNTYTLPFIDALQDLSWTILKTPYVQEFVTTDNPVIWHDFEQTENTNKFIPYKYGLQSRHLEVIFPITKKLIAIGRRNDLSFKNFSYQEISSESFVRKMNRYLVISAENFIFSTQTNLQKLVQNNSHLVPTIRHVEIPHKTGTYSFCIPDLGSPHDLPKWTQEDEKNFISAQP